MLLTFADKADRALSFFGIFKFIGLVGLVVLLAYLTTRLVSKGYMRGYNTREFELVDKLLLGPDKSLVLVKLKAADKFYILSLDKSGTRVVDALENLELAAVSGEAKSPLEKRSFKDIFNQFGGDKK